MDIPLATQLQQLLTQTSRLRNQLITELYAQLHRGVFARGRVELASLPQGEFVLNNVYDGLTTTRVQVIADGRLCDTFGFFLVVANLKDDDLIALSQYLQRVHETAAPATPDATA